ncbi:Calcium-dependent protease precursor [Sphingobacterium spiritivorum]|uniref:Calcium-dependent protease n=1 Tax=Sphingobacterium spiritivorum TaxID=258 RepID=A0A380BX56_SPHSI|nr:S8 family serine peptidase [Sphingobacterium spiritivorum]SUJ07722.1 Calcium-dependent protease precursor [Sphingobacterium spiritivorum]
MKNNNFTSFSIFIVIFFCLIFNSCKKDFPIDNGLDDKNLLQLLAKSNNEMYYWSGNEKHYFTYDTTLLLVQIKDRITNLPQLSRSLQNSKTLRVENDSTIQIIVQGDAKSDLLQKREALNIKSYYPSIKLPNGKGVAFITDRISIKFKQKMSNQDLIGFAKKHDLNYISTTPYGAEIFKAITPVNTCKIANYIHENEAVEWSNPDFVQLIERYVDYYPNQYYLNNTGQTGGIYNIDINAPEAWDITLGRNVRVAVIDDGVEAHPEFGSRLLSGFTAGSNNTLGAPLNHASKGHGVASAGIIAAAHDDNDGIKGIAPNSLILPVNIFPYAPANIYDSGAVTSSEIATAINWAWRPDRGNADVLSNSWGGGLSNNDIISEITNARTNGRNGLGAIVVFASGNNNPAVSGVSFPSSVNDVLTVGAIDKNGNIWNYSQRGPEMDLVAPSGNVNLSGDVYTTDRVGNWGYNSDNYMSNFGGTSAACPQVAGVAALMLSVNPNLTESQVRSHLQASATDMGPSGFDNTFGYGRLNAEEALKRVIPTISGPNSFCASSTYTIAAPPSGATVSWDISPQYATINASTNTSVTISQNPNWSGDITLMGQISQGGYSYKIKKSIKVGTDPNLIGYALSSPLAPKSTMFNYNGVGYFNPGTQYFEIESLDGKKISPMPYGFNPSQNNSSIVQGAGFRLGDSYQSQTSIYIRARFYNTSTCGWSNWRYMTVNF